VIARSFAALLALSALAAASPASADAPKPPGPATLTRVEADTLRTKLLDDRRETLKWLSTAPTSYLATVQRRDFEGKATLTVGRAADNDVRLDDAGVLDHHLRVTVVGDSFHVEALGDTTMFMAGGERTHARTVAPSSIAVGKYILRLSHQRFPAIIVFDPASPRFADYKGLQWYEPDFKYRFVLPMTANPTPDTVIILSTRGNQSRALRVGWFDFAVNGTPCRLEATRLLEPGVGENSVSIFFRDATTGKETYGVGRYVDAEPRPDGNYVLDFNDCYNPACAVSEHYNCPIPPKANVLKVAIRAGEKDSHYLH